jgi:hypothetical protein
LLLLKAIWLHKRGFGAKARVWSSEDITLAQTLAYHISMSIQQQLMYQELQEFNLTLKQQVQAQTSELEKSLLITDAVRLISQQIVVEKHGGMIECTSKPNQNTEFMIEIPLKQAIMHK